jgi:hypothetical protein
LRPPVQRSVLNRLGQMLLADLFAAGEVGNGAGDFEDAGVGAGGETEAVGDHLHQFLSGLVEGAELSDLARFHGGVADCAATGETFPLDLPGSFHSGADGGGGFSIRRIGKILIGHLGNFHLQVDTVQ